MRRLHKAFLRYHAPENWEIIHDALIRMGRRDLIGSGERHLIPSRQPVIPVSSTATGIANGKRIAAPKMNTFGKKPAPRTSAGSVAPRITSLSYNTAKPKTAPIKSGRK